MRTTDDPGHDTPLVLGPVLRRVANGTATVWVETSEPTTVRVLAGDAEGSSRTFGAFGHHYALVVVDGLVPGTDVEYEVWLGTTRVWPVPDSPHPPSRIRTLPAGSTPPPVRLVFGSCRVATPSAEEGYPPDALDTYARLLARDPTARPDLLMLLGDQVYADQLSPSTDRFMAQHRAAGAPAPTGSPDEGPDDDPDGNEAVADDPPGDEAVGDDPPEDKAVGDKAVGDEATGDGAVGDEGPDGEVGDFEEYTRLYHESWRDPEIRWLLSTVPTVMVFDDHEIVDDWNTSAAWHDHVRKQRWWRPRIVGGIASYWIYQHLGNLAPDELATDPTARQVLAADDASTTLARLALTTDRPATSASPRWSYRLDVARTRIVVLDNRCGRVLTPGARQMLADADWDWLAEAVTGDYDHLVLGASLPWLLPPAIHELETWNERLCDSPHPRIAAGAEWLRQTADMEHWAAFRTSFERLGRLLRAVGRGRYTRRAPASISVLSGDVHHSYVAEAWLGDDVTSRVHQVTCSPTHNQAPSEMKVGFRLGWSRYAVAIGAGLARLAGVPKPEPSWRRVAGPYFHNAIGTLELSGRAARTRLDGTERAGDGRAHLRPLAQVPLAWRND